jgi:hypothetical protein
MRSRLKPRAAVAAAAGVGHRSGATVYLDAYAQVRETSETVIAGAIGVAISCFASDAGSAISATAEKGGDRSPY